MTACGENRLPAAGTHAARSNPCATGAHYRGRRTGGSPQGALTLRPHPGSRPGSAQRKQHGEGQAINTVNEVWNPVVGYEGLYEVSNLGRVRGLQRGKILKQKKDKHGYVVVILSKKGKKKDKRVHRLILEAFVGPLPDGMVTRHLDGDPLNNNISNLQYGSSSENNLDTVRHGRHHWANRTHCPQGHKLTPENLTEHSKKLRRRTCLACARMRGYLQHHPELRDSFQQVSDRYYQAIIKEGVQVAQAAVPAS